MTRMNYDTSDYAASRLVDTIVRIGQDPVRIISVNDLAAIEVESLIRARRKRVNFNELNLEPVQLGYVNYQGQAVYACRMPKRNDWRQGLRYDNMYFSYHNATADIGVARPVDSDDRHTLHVSEGPTPPIRRRRPSGSRPSWSSIYQTIRGNYPSIESCLEKIKSVDSVAWSRDFAMINCGERVDIGYMGDFIVGHVDNGNIVLDKKFEYLEERLKEK